MRVRISVTGDRELMDAMRALGQVEMVAAGKEVLGNKSLEMLAIMRPLTPVEPLDGGHLASSERVTRPVYTKRGVISAGVMAGGAPLAGYLASTHHKTNIYALVQELGEQVTRDGKHVVLHHTTGQSHFMDAAAQRVAPSVPDALWDAIDRRANAGR